MHRSPLAYPVGTLRHLTAAEVEAAPELAALARLTEAGWRWRGVALPASLEEGFYRLNNLPRRLAALYAGLDPRDPDEDIVEEAEEEALALVGQHYLLDETVDAIYEALSGLPAAVTVRRPDAGAGLGADHPRAALLAVKHLMQADWRVDAVLDRLSLTASLALDARPVLVTPADERDSEAASRRASELLGSAVRVRVDAHGDLTGVRLA